MNASKDHGKTRRRLGIVGLIALACALVLIATPYAIQYQISQLLRELGASEASVADVDFNPFSGTFEISGLSFSSAGAKGQRLEKLSVDLHMLALLQKRIHLRHISLDGLKLALAINPAGQPVIGGLALAPGAPKADKQTPKGSPWDFGIDTINLSQITLDYHDPKVAGRVRIASFQAKELASWKRKQPTRLSLEAKFNEGRIEFSGKAQPLAKNPAISGKAVLKRLELKPFAPLIPQLGTLEGQLSLDAMLNLTQAPDSTLAISHSGTITLEKFHAQNPELDLRQGQMVWNGKLALTIKGGQIHPAMDAALTVRDLSSTSGATELARVGSMATQIKFDTLDSIHLTQSSIEQLLLGAQLYTDPSRQDATEDLLTIAKLSIPRLSLTAMKQLEIDELTLSGIRAIVRRDKDKAWAAATLVEALPSAGTKTSTAAPAAGAEAEGDKASEVETGYRLGKLTFSGENHILFEDRGVSPPYRTDITVKSLTLGTIDSATPQQPSPFHLLATVDKHGEIELDGSITPLAKKPTFDLSKRIKALPLSPLTSYARPITDYRLKSGQLDSSGKVKMGGGNIEGEISLTLNALEVEAVQAKREATDLAPEEISGESTSAAHDGAEINKLDAKLGLPLGVALNMLRDSHGTIKLSIPISGSSEQPDIDPADVINTVIAKALKQGAMGYLIATLQPYGTVISLVKMAGESALKVRLDPLNFEPASSVIDATARDYLPKVVKLMAERPELNIKLCAVATAGDQQALLAQARAATEAAKREAPAQQDKAKAAAGPISVSDEQLLALAKTRVAKVKDLLVTELKADATHLVDCLPRIERDEKANPPRIELLI